MSTKYIASIVGTLFIILVFGFNALSFLLEIVTDERGLGILGFRVIRLGTIHYDEIDYVSRKERYTHLSAFNMTTRFFRPGFLIVLKHHWFARAIIVTPATPDAFAKTLQDHGVTLKP